MNRHSRRRAFALLGVSLGLFAVQGCASNAALTPAQIIADTQGAVNGLLAALPALSTLVPQSTLTTIGTNLGSAATLLSGLNTTATALTGATALKQVEGYLNAALNSLAAFPIPAPYSLIIAAASVIAPEVEAWVNSVLTPTAPTVSVVLARKLAPSMTLLDARKALSIPTKS